MAAAPKRLTRIVVTASFLLTPSAVSLAGQTPSTAPIKVHVYTAPAKDGFVDDESKGRADSLADVRKALEGKKKTLGIVSDSDTAEVTIEVTRRGWELADGTFLGPNPVTGSSVEQSGTVRATLRVGDYSTELVGKGGHYQGVWRNAARAIANQVDKWIKDNRGRIPRK